MIDVFPGKDKQHYIRIGNPKQPLATSEGYSSKAAAEAGKTRIIAHVLEQVAREKMTEADEADAEG